MLDLVHYSNTNGIYIYDYPVKNNSMDGFERINRITETYSNENIAKQDTYLEKINTIIKLNVAAMLNINPPRIKKQLKVREVDIMERAELKKVVERWIHIANYKETQANLVLPNLFYENLPDSYYYMCPNIFTTSSNICKDIFCSLKRDETFANKKFYMCSLAEASTNGVEAIATVSLSLRHPKKPSYLFISELASHPKNLISPINRHELDCVAGAAAKLINHLIEQVCPQLNINQIRLISTAEARGFYKKLGFKYDGWIMKLKLNSYPEPI